MSQKILITGASGGIGSAIARTFAINNYEVLLQYNKNSESALYLEKLFKDNNCKCSIFKADLLSTEDIKNLANKVSDIDVLINNAGISENMIFTDMSDEQILNTLNLNLTAAMLLTKYLLPKMIKKKRGKIINISSVWGITGASCEVAYSSAKAGLIGFTKALAKEVGPSGICVNCVAPGAIKTNMLSEYSKETLENLANSTPLMRLGEPSDIASLVYFLASEKADFITGQIISPNGGLVI